MSACGCRYRHRGVFQSPPGATSNQGTFGEPGDGWQDEYVSRFELLGGGGTEILVAEQRQGDRTSTVRMRWRRNQPLPSWRIKYTGDGSVRYLHLAEPPRDEEGTRRELVFTVKEQIGG